MKQLITRISGIALILCLFAGMFPVFGQVGVLDPNDPVVNYSSSNPPTQPQWGQIKDWVRTKALSWNTDDYKCYIYQGMVFRLKFPKSYQHNVADGKKYPLYIFFHGLGEYGTIYDNENQLVHGGQSHMNAVNQDKFDGFLFYPQNQYGYFGPAQFAIIKSLIENYFVPQIKVDINRIIVDGLSAGGSATWDFALQYPQLVAGMLPISAANNTYTASSVVNVLKYIPIWHFQGGEDKNPAPGVSKAVGQALLNAGANYRYTEYPNRGHSCWNDAWAESDYYPFLNNAHKANPVALYGKHEFCEGEAVSVTLGVTAGFSGYQWRKDGVVIPGATSNTYHVTSYGTYECRIRRGTEWSPWSPSPVVVKLKDPTVTPPIQPVPGMSSVIPSLASEFVTLQVPAGYETYVWQRVGSSTVLSTTNTLNVTTPGSYIVKVTEKFGCVSNFSDPYVVSSSTGPNKPDPVTNVKVTTVSSTSLKVDWMDNPNPSHNETAFEIYTATAPGGPYFLAGVAPANSTSYIIDGLQVGTKYYVVIRAINETAGSETSPEAEGVTTGDNIPPTAPGNFRRTASNGNNATFAWNASTDNVGVYKYDLYINGKKSYVIPGNATSFRVYNLREDIGNLFVLKARDSAGNVSAPSAINFYVANNSGLRYKYYHGTWTSMPNFNELTPEASGHSTSGVTISPRTRNDNFAFLWEGYINITTGGTYTFRTTSEDGSLLWIGEYDPEATPLVNNDGEHSNSSAQGTIDLQPGVYPITIAYFHRTGSESMSVSWRTPGSNSFVTIPSSQFLKNDYSFLPEPPANVNAVALSYKKIQVSWTDKSDNETGFEILRSTSPNSGYTTIGEVGANVTSYIDSINVVPGTKYYYQVRANCGHGQSVATGCFIEANYQFNGNLNDSGPNNITLSGSGNPVFDASVKMEGSHSLNLSGASNQYVTINSPGNFLKEAYAQRTFAFWMKSGNNTGTRMVLDIGGSDDGIAIRIVNGELQVGIASNNNRQTLPSVAYNTTDWNHIALVYDRNSLTLYINGEAVSSRNDLPFTALTTTSNGSRIGANNGSNAFNTTSGLSTFLGKIDNMMILSGAVPASQIGELMNGNYAYSSYVQTPALPNLPGAPSALVASEVGNSSVELSWTDNADNESGYEIYRSYNNADNFVLVGTVGADVTSYEDTNLFSNANFFYKVRAINDGGASDFSNAIGVATSNNLPVFTPVAKQYMHYSGTLQVNVEASDLDNGTVTLTPSNLPSFASFQSTGNGKGVITFNPASSGLMGTYSGITVTATDQQNGSVNLVFDLEVNDNYSPVISPVSNVTVKEKENTVINLTATDANGGDQLSWTFTGLPSFASANANGGNVAITLTPGYTDHGPYQVKAVVTDGHNGYDSATFTINVTDVAPNSKIYFNFSDGSYSPGAPWNSPNNQPALNNIYRNMKDANGNVTSVGYKIMTPWQNIGNGTNVLGAVTGNNSGVYPDNVMRTAYWTDAATQQIRFFGLDPNAVYNITFFGSRGGVSDNRTSNYTINGVTVSLNAANNTQNTVTMYNVHAASDSSITLTLTKAAGSAYAYLNAMILEAVADEDSEPAKPRNISAQFANGKVSLTWLDAAYNESRYEIYRAESLTGPYVLLNPGAVNPNTEEYTDSTAAGGKTYYYSVKAANSLGASEFSDTVSVSTPNVAPVITGFADVRMKTHEVRNINFTVFDPGDIITLNTSGLPSFATLNYSNGSGTLVLNPGATIGNFPNVTITATDSKGASTSAKFDIIVTDKDITAIYVNFNQHQYPVGAPWNNFNSAAFAGKTISNLMNDEQQVTPVSVTLVTAWEGDNDLGAVTGNNTGVFPDNVMKTAYYESSSTPKVVRISGLSTQPGMKYNLVFFASRAAGDIRNTVYSSGGNSVTLNVSNNTNTTVQLNGLVPNANGVIEFTVTKGAGAPYAYIGAMVIQSYFDNGQPIAPSNLIVAAKSKSSIQLNWADKSGNEDGFQIFRALNPNGPFNLIHTTGANATSYLNTGLQENTMYYYKVRAVKGNAYSDFTNIMGISTYTMSVYINFNRTNNASNPWYNNTARAPEEGYVFSNLRNDKNQQTGINMTVVRNFSGDNPSGMNTGNNSGVVPDNVMRSSWWLDYGLTAELKLTGFNQNWAYTFVFFGSRNGGGDRTSIYTIGNRSVALNASYNTAQTVQIENVRPDENGEISIIVSLAQYAEFAYLNGMIIHGYEVADDIEANLGDTQSDALVPGDGEFKALIETTSDVVTPKTDEAVILTQAMEHQLVVTKLQVFPNPVIDEIKVSAVFEKAQSNVSLRVMDLAGRTVYTQNFGKAQGGSWTQRLNLGKHLNKPGVYLLQITGDEKSKPATFKLLKSN